MHSASVVHVLRLTPHQDLKREILAFAKTNGIKAGIMLTCVGSLEQYHLRFANQKMGTKQKGFFEIVSAEGTFSDTAAHLHIGVAYHEGKIIGGHLLDENLIYTTAEIAFAELTNVIFERVKDPVYGYLELLVKGRKDQP